jgi:hypothetical protein
LYPRGTRSLSSSRPPSVVLSSSELFAAIAKASDEAAPLDERVLALWSAAHADAFARPAPGERTIAERIGALLDEADLVLASEAIEALHALTIASAYAASGGTAENLAVSVDKRGRLAVAGHTLEALAQKTKAPEIVRVVPLVKIASLAPLAQAPVLAWPKIVPGHDLLVERTAHPKLPAGALRVRGDEALLGSLRDASLALPIPRRQLRVRRAPASVDIFTIADVYAEGFTSLKGTALAGAIPIANVPNGVRVDVAGENNVAGIALTLRYVPRLDRSAGVTVRFVDQGRRLERLAVGEALFFGPDVDDDVVSTVRGRLVATAKGPVVVSAAPMPWIKLDGADVVVRDVR